MAVKWWINGYYEKPIWNSMTRMEIMTMMLFVFAWTEMEFGWGATTLSGCRYQLDEPVYTLKVSETGLASVIPKEGQNRHGLLGCWIRMFVLFRLFLVFHSERFKTVPVVIKPIGKQTSFTNLSVILDTYLLGILIFRCCCVWLSSCHFTEEGLDRISCLYNCCLPCSSEKARKAVSFIIIQLKFWQVKQLEKMWAPWWRDWIQT